MGYKKYETLVDPTDVVKFGKRVNYESRLTNDAVMEEHLRQMRDKMDKAKMSNDLKRKTDLEFLQRIKKLDEMEFIHVC